ncbi:MAG: HAD-IIIA family hydrolase [Acidobacteriaceae bacterium]|nr:HAD-IIIA family hydrolase [Acidobacteriaceae bacterium]MBV9294122.1 HAD-IIIA family hydrolase [Acidobacteriaceae bacterium]
MNAKIFDREELSRWVANQRSLGFKVGFTCGAFDILHAGHVEYLTRAREYCDRLVAAVNSDSSIRTYKSPLRPINTEEQRQFVLAGLEAVDAVTLMHEVRPAPLLELLKPDVYIKGGDYSTEQLKSKALIESYGGQVVCIPIAFPTSTSDILKRAALLSLHEDAPRAERKGEQRLVFLDRDGTLIRDVPFLHDPSLVELMPGVLEGLRMLEDAGFTLVLITNQQGIGLGYYTEHEFIEVNRALLRKVAPAGINIARIYYCPHSQADLCQCRKPGSLLLENALRYYGVKPERCYLIGDSAADCVAGERLRIPSIVISGDTPVQECTQTGRSFTDAVNWIMASEAQLAAPTLA